MAPKLLYMTINAEDTALSVGPALLLIPQDRKAGPFGKQPEAAKNTARYFIELLLAAISKV